ncbi:hypothetical protein ACDA63_07260 [Uliginosibacterium sp. sgz301328]|uniref:hypothetical protein n=1 Tax=Uliginosibacterium sp. sgz301328 TaxID=3243764 RepID=UPI00359CFEDF
MPLKIVSHDELVSIFNQELRSREGGDCAECAVDAIQRLEKPNPFGGMWALPNYAYRGPRECEGTVMQIEQDLMQQYDLRAE